MFRVDRISLSVQRALDVLDEEYFVDQPVKLAGNINRLLEDLEFYYVSYERSSVKLSMLVFGGSRKT